MKYSWLILIVALGALGASCPPSANNATLTPGTIGNPNTAVLTDSSGNGWGAPFNGQVFVNGTSLPWTSNTAQLAYANTVIWYKNSSNQWYSFTMSGTNLGAIASGPTTTSPISNAPVILSPATLTATQNVSISVGTMSATDVVNPSDTMSFTGTSTLSGKLTATGATGNGTGTITFSGNLAALNTMLGTITFIDAVVENPKLTWGFTDQHSGSASASTTVAVFPPPSPNCTTVTTIGPVINSAGPPPATWSIDSSGRADYNGAALTGTANVIELAYVGGTVWQKNTSLDWYSFTATGGDGLGPTKADPTASCIVPIGPTYGTPPRVGPIESTPPQIGPVEGH